MPSRSYGPEAQVVAFPLGGIGTGNVSLGSRGELRDWEISNRPDKGAWLPYTFFAIRIATDGTTPMTRVLEGRLQPPHDGDSGYMVGHMAGLPRMTSSRMRGEYPLASVDLLDDALPVDVRLDAFTPLVPLDADDSGIPGAVLRYVVSNPTDEWVDVSIAGTMSNPVAITGRGPFHHPVYRGGRTLEFRQQDGLSGLLFGTDIAPTDTDFGTAVLATADETVTSIPDWPINMSFDAAQLFWDAFTSDGRLAPIDPELATLVTGGSTAGSRRIGSLCVEHRLAPGAAKTFEFLLSWHTPNRVKAWNGNIRLPNTHADEIVSNHYVRRYTDAWSVARDLSERMPALEQATSAFHSAIHDSSLPRNVIDAVSSTLVALRSTTCFRIDDGSDDGIFAMWEGSFDHAGSCEGNCTHVWNYAQSVAHLFPSLERNARRTEFGREVEPNGKMRFRLNSVFDAEPDDDLPAASDGQLGTIVRLYREWLISGDDEFLRELWPAAIRALEYAFTQWDDDGDYVLDGEQRNTYDIDFIGESSLSNSLFLAALRACAAMAAHLGEEELERRYTQIADLAAVRIDEMLFNGEYYEQRIDDPDAVRYQYGKGCLSDQVFGQTLAHLTGLGHILPAEHVRSALEAIMRHNFTPDLSEHESVQRTYALNDEAGLLLCTWPHGGRPRLPFIYCDEVWTGIEYQVATNMVYEGMVEEALTIVAAVHDRHDGVRRNPWNQVECGNHYARSLASWGVLIALTGAQWTAPEHRLHVAPRSHVFSAHGTADFIVTVGTGWGRARFTPGGATLTVLGGTASVRSLTAEHPVLGDLEAELDELRTLHAGESITLTIPRA